MKKITLIIIFLIIGLNETFGQAKQTKNATTKITSIIEIYKRVQIDKSIPNVVQKLVDAGVDLGCGVYHTDKYIQIELSDYELKRISDQGISYTVLIDDVTKFYADRAKKDMPFAQSNL
jgi:hypothetical protein